jgi:mono/diheme cytochrome c family protein
MAQHDNTALQDNPPLAAAVLLIVVIVAFFAVGVAGIRSGGGDTAAASQTASGGSTVVVNRPFDPARAYAISCSGCHGAQAEGIAGIAGPMFASELMAEASREALFTFLTESRPITDVYAFYHPVRGEYPGYSDAQLEELIDYLYTLG